MAFVYWLHTQVQTDIFTTGYVGVTTKLVEDRYKQHKYDAKNNSQLAIHKAIRKYGDLVVDVILEGSEEYCYLIESKLRPLPSTGYNAAVGGGVSPTTGTRHSEETRKKISESQAGENHSGYGKKQSSELVAKRVAGNLKTRCAKIEAGIFAVVSQETRDKLSKVGKGQVRSEEARKNYSRATRGERNPNFGRTGWKDPKCNKVVWTAAIKLFDLYNLCGTCGKAKLATLSSKFTSDNLETIVKWFKSGWNPSEDSAYLAWLEQYKAKEASNANT